MENPTSDEKVLAAFAHASVVLSFFGPIAPTLIWASQRDKSKYVRYHALQAMGYQTFLLWGWIIVMFAVVFGGVILLALLAAFFAELNPASMSLAPFLIQPIIFLLIFGVWGLFFLGGFIGAFFCMTGRTFKYPLIGSWLSTRAFGDGIPEAEQADWEDSWVGGVCHATAIIQMWGVVTPLIVWFSQKGRSAKIHFQALQATIYQLLAMFAYFAGMFVYMLSFFLLFFSAMIFGPTADSNTQGVSTVFGIILMIFLGVMMLFWFGLMLAMPAYYLLAAVGSVLTLRGRNFKYPILGAVIFRRLNSAKLSEQQSHDSI